MEYGEISELLSVGEIRRGSVVLVRLKNQRYQCVLGKAPVSLSVEETDTMFP